LPRTRPNNSRDRRRAYDTEVVRNAKYFTAVLWQPRGQSRRLEFSDLGKAMRAASEMRDEHGRTALLYAIDAHGHDAELSRKDWQHWLDVWREAHR
jgi:hypothetical protein